MSPYTLDLPPLPIGETDGSNDLLPDYYGDGSDDSIPEGIPVPLEAPQAVEPPPPEETALDIYLREKADREAQEQAAATEKARRQQSLTSYIQSPDLEQKLAGEDNIPAGVELNATGQELAENAEQAKLVINQAREQEFQKDFGWLQGQPLPGWTKYKEGNIGDKWEGLTPEQKSNAFNHYSNRARNYYVNYAGADPDEFDSKLQNVLIGNHDLIDAQVGATQNKLDSMGYGRGWKDKVVRAAPFTTGQPGFEAMSAQFARNEAFNEAQGLIKTLHHLNRFDNIFNPDKTINKEKYANAVRMATESLNDDLSDPDRDSAGQVQESQSKQADIMALGDDPQGKINTLLGVAKDYNNIAGLETAKQSPELSEALSGKRILPSPLGAKDSQLSSKERIDKIMNHKAEFASLTAGMFFAQMSDLLEENVASTAAAIYTGQPLVGVAGSTLAAGQQEATLVATDVLLDGLREKGYNPYDLTDWQRAYDNGIVSELAAKATREGQAKGLTTAAVESGLELVFRTGLKRIPFFGSTASGLGYIGRKAAKGGSHTLASMTAAGAGEAAGQGAAYGTLDPVEVLTEALASPVGTGIQASQIGLSELGSRIINGKKTPVVTEEAIQTEVSPTAPTISDDRTTVEELSRGLQPTTTPEGSAADAKEVSTEIPTEAGDVTGGGEQSVAAETLQNQLTESELAHYEELKVLSAEEKAAYIQQEIDTSPNTERRAANKEIADSIQRRLSVEEAIRQSPLGMEGLRTQLEEQSKVSEPLPVVEADTALKQALAENQKTAADIVALSNMVVKKGKDTQAGFLDVGLAIDGLHEAAVTAWSKAKDFASWSADMLTQFGDKVKPVLKELWNRVTALVRGVHGFVEGVLTSGVIKGRNVERGGVGINYGTKTRAGKRIEFLVSENPTQGLNHPISGRKEGAFRITFLEDGKPTFHEAYDTIEEAKDTAKWYQDQNIKDGQKSLGMQVLSPRNTQRGVIDLRTQITQSIEEAGIKDSPQLTSVAKSINLSYLDRDQRKVLADTFKKIGKDFKAARAAGVDPTKSKAIFDEAMQRLSLARVLAWDREFEILSKQYPESLKDKTYADFQSGKEARAFVAMNGAESEKVELQEKQSKTRAKSEKAKEEKDKLQQANTVESQRKAIATLDAPEFKALSKEKQAQVLKAMKYLLTQKPADNSKQKNESIVAAINNFIEGNFIGGGEYASLQRMVEFSQDLDVMVAKYGGRIPFFDKEGVLNQARELIEGVVAGGEKTKTLFKKEARIRALGFSHPELRKLWNKHIGNYLEKAQTENSQLQQEKTERLFNIGLKHGLAKKKFLGKLKTGDRNLWDSKANPSLRRLQAAAQITMWEADSDNPLSNINDNINDLYTSIGNEKKGPFLGAQGAANEAAFMSIIRPALDDGMLIQTEEGFQVDATPEVWHDYVMSKLTDTERAALIDYRKLASEFEPGLKFVSEFYYGKEWRPQQHYMPRTVFDPQGEGQTAAPELTATTATPLPDGTEVTRHGSVLHLRKRLGRGQYYGMNLGAVLQNSLNTAAYEVTTAESRFAIDKVLKSKAGLKFFGDNKVRLNRFKDALKLIHQAELHQGTGLKQPSNLTVAFAQDIFNTASNSILSLMLGRFHQFPAQFASAFVGGYAMMGNKMFGYASQWKSAWDAKTGRQLYNDAFPDLLQRKEQVDPFFDRSTARSVLDSLADISLNAGDEFTDAQKNMVYTARVKRAVSTAVEGPPKFLARWATNHPDYYAVQEIFPMLLQDALIKNGIITKLDEFTPANIAKIQADPRYSEALAEAKTKVSDVMGNANRFSLRPDIFVFRSDQNPLIRTVFGLMQTVTQFAGDRVLDMKDMTYFNKSDPHAVGIRRDAYKRAASGLIQGVAYKYIAGYIAHAVLSALAPAVGSVEGLDEEEKKVLDKMNRIRGELLEETTMDGAIKELTQMIFGPFATNSVGSTVIDVAYGKAIAYALKEDMDKRKAELNKLIEKEKNPSKKEDMMLERDGLIKYTNLLNLTGNKSGFNLGPVPSKIMRVVQDKDISNSEADVIQEQYWKSGGLKTKPSPNKAARLAVWAASYASGDINAAKQQADRARTLVARARKVQLDEQQRNSNKKVDAINIGGLR